MDLGHGIGRGTIFGGTRYWERYCIFRDTVLEEVQYLEGHEIGRDKVIGWTWDTVLGEVQYLEGHGIGRDTVFLGTLY